jgi:type IV fimbrial biogenesis protein FimT
MNRPNHRPNHHPHRSQRGVTLIESMAVLTIASVLIGSAAPLFDDMRSRWQVEGAAALLETQLQYARSAAVTRQHPVRVAFESADGQACYVIHTGAKGACQCANPALPTCPADVEQLALTRYDGARAIALSATARDIGFDGDTGTVTPTTSVTMTSPRGQALKEVVNIMGRVRSCSPAGSIGGHPSC